MQNKKKIFNDPVYGFISIPDEIHFDIIEHPYFQRLRRIKQLGMSHFVYPGALHTRFNHSLGAMYLMQSAIQTLRSKGKHISHDEARAVSLAILLHDVGHGPYSHTLEQSIVEGISHEQLSLLIMQNLLKQELLPAETIEIFRDSHPKSFLSGLVSSQLDMDRIDYLRRDSFFTGVSEGAINTERLITMLDVVDNELVIEAKGIYSVENFIVSRRLMYWQVYLHKTVLAAESMLTNILRRAKQLAFEGHDLFATPALKHFLYNSLTLSDFENDEMNLIHFTELDDYDIFASIKVWSKNPDKILSYLCRCIVNRNLFKSEISDVDFDGSRIESLRIQLKKRFEIKDADVSYLLYHGTTSNKAYDPNQPNINILYKDGSIRNITEAADQLNISVLATPVVKHYLCYPK
ncbi:MAG: HD domain-containing protein [Bacteroidales bacterium]